MAEKTLQYYLKHYARSAREVTLDFETHRDQVDPENYIPFFRTRLQELLDEDPSQFTMQELTRLKNADQVLLDNLEDALKWVGQVYFDRRGISRREWWWWLDEIEAGGMDPPDMDQMFRPNKKQTEVF